MKKRISLFLLAAILGAADTLTLKNGSSISGRFVSSNGLNVRFVIGSQENTFDINEVDSVRFGRLPAGAVPSAAPVGVAVKPQIPAVQQGFTIPPGYQVLVRLIDPVDSKKDDLGRTYRASLEQAITVNGVVAIPRGAAVVAVLREEQQSGGGARGGVDYTWATSIV